MASSRNPNSNPRWSSALGLVRPAFVLLLLALLPVAVLTGRTERGATKTEASGVHHENDRAGSTGHSTRQA